MSEHAVYKIVELAGSSPVGYDDAVRAAIARASATLRHIRWFEVTQMRGHVEDGRVAHFQVELKVGFTLEEGQHADA
jgi:flavin-binding protein dodecin